MRVPLSGEAAGHPRHWSSIASIAPLVRKPKALIERQSGRSVASPHSECFQDRHVFRPARPAPANATLSDRRLQAGTVHTDATVAGIAAAFEVTGGNPFGIDVDAGDAR